MKQTVTVSAHHWIDQGEDVARQRSKRQDITFVIDRDSIEVVLPPPASCMLYIDVSPRVFLDLLERVIQSQPEKT
jgi:hypothetical protein